MFGRNRAAAFTFVASLAAAAPARAETDGKISDSGISGPPYAAIYEDTAALARAHVGWADVFDYGRSPQGRPLRLIRIQSPVRAAAGGQRPAVLISGATHGNEYLHVEDRLAGYFLAERERGGGVQRFLAQGGLLYVVPIVNPDGYEAKRRENSRGVDLNRDFDLLPTKEAHFRETESRALAEFLAKDFAAQGVQLKLAVDYHCCDGSILYPWAYTDTPLPAEALQAHEQVARLMQQDVDPSYSIGPTGPVLGYNPRGTSKDYYYARYGALAFTFEGTYRDEAKKFPGHTAFWSHILSQLSGGA
jgi:hypothetical protein